MLVPDDVRKCSAFVYYKASDGMNAIGTAFVLASRIEGTDRAWPAIITARHLLSRVQRHSTDSIVYLRFNLLEGGTDWIPAPLSYWRFHPDETADVAVFPYMPGDKFDFLPFATESSATPDRLLREGFGVGDEVFVVGLFANHLGRTKNVPIVRVGNLAAMPEEKIETRHFGSIEAYLIEARSIGGLSGAPVFVHKSSVRVHDQALVLSDSETGIFRLLGLIHGHFDVTHENQATLTDEKINMGIAMVVPASKILETLDQPELRAMKNAQKEKIAASTRPAGSQDVNR